jgi:hypothetical protein
MLTLETLADAATVGTLVWSVVGGVVAGLGTSVIYTKFFRKKEKRLISNWKRPIAIIPSAQDPMAQEARLLKDAVFFDNIDLLPADGRSADHVTDKYRLVVLRYDKTSSYFWDTYDRIAQRQIPVIIYAQQGEISPDDFRKIQQYLFHTICNTPVRLLSDVSAIMATYPEGK